MPNLASALVHALGFRSTSRLLSVLFFCLVTGYSLAGQQQPPPQVSPPTTLRTDARVVVLDVVVTDKHGVGIHDLSAADFQVREDGALQTIKSMEEHRDVSAATPGPSTPQSQQSSSAVHTNRPAPGAEVWNVVLYDQFNTPQADQQRARKELTRFANSLAPHTQVALLSFSGALHILSSFSDGQPGMVKVLASDQLQARNGPLLQPYNADEQFDLQQFLNKMKPQQAKAVRDNQRETEMGELEVRVKSTLAAFSALTSWLQQYPGKKNIYWLSGGFPLTAEPQRFRDQDGLSYNSQFREDYFELQQRVNARLATARIAIFPLDIRGIVGAVRDGIESVDIKGAQYVKNPQLYNEDVGQADDRVAQEYAEMLDVAQATGGLARFN